MKTKTQILQEIILKKKADALFLNPSHPNHRWLLEKKMEGSFIVVPKSGKAILFKSSLEEINSKKSKEFKLIEIKSRKQINLEIKKLKIKKLCVDYSKFTFNHKKLFKGSKIIDVSDLLSNARTIKSKEEIKNIEIANKHTAKCFNELISAWKIKKFKHETDAIKFIKEYAAKNNLGQAFDPLVASGINAAVPHHLESTKINKGFCVIDFGFEYKGYKADMTRTIYLGVPSKKEKETYELLFNVQRDLITMSLPKTKASELDDVSRKMLGKESKYFIHSLGHGVGLEIHESPGIARGVKEILKEGMIITIEPGIYDKKRKLGIRIEDSILIKKGYPKILTKDASKKLIVI